MVWWNKVRKMKNKIEISNEIFFLPCDEMSILPLDPEGTGLPGTISTWDLNIYFYKSIITNKPIILGWKQPELGINIVVNPL